MIRGALGSRYGINPLGRGVRRASTGYTTWWTLDGDYLINDSWDGWQGSFKARYVNPSRYIYRIVSYKRNA